ncbi:MAG: hypothetical protein KY391_03440 [Actinobacteria bacterium]|nr:hypothetical protein [Actinomycetota bacterium]
MLEVTLVLTNASDHYSGCAKFPLSVWTCNGTADGDNKTYGYSAAVGSSGVDPGDVTNPVVSAVKVRPAPVPRGKTARFGFHLDERARVRVVILRSGRKIATSNAAEFAAGSRCCVKWPVPRRAATGRYTAKVVATDPSGNKGVAKKVFKVVK